MNQLSSGAQNSQPSQLEERTEHQMVEVVIESPEHYKQLTGRDYALVDKAVRFGFHPETCPECNEITQGIGKSSRA